MIRGIGTSKGIGIGHALIIDEPQIEAKTEIVSDTAAELRRYENVKKKFIADTQNIIEELKKKLKKNDKTSLVLQNQIYLIEDIEMNQQITGFIENEHLCADAAVDRTCSLYADIFASLDSEVMNQRVADIEDLKHRILSMLSGNVTVDLSNLEPDTIIVAKQLHPSVTAAMDTKHVVGIIAEKGGETSHAAILARALEIPAVLSVKDACSKIADNESVIVDGEYGEVFLKPIEKTVQIYTKKKKEYQKKVKELKKYIDRETVTSDGYKVCLAVNIGNEDDAVKGMKSGAEGVGLFRTEFLFMNGVSMPDEEKQFEAYKKAAIVLKGKTLTIRTLDVGGDKNIPYMGLAKETNPFLGYRAIRFCLGRVDVFTTQLRAILRASAFGKVRIMIPLVTSLEEVLRVKTLLKKVKESLDKQKIPYDKDIKLGIMIETPAAALISDLLAKEVDFFSIGTNDLTQYTMAVDRGNENVAYLYSVFHPSVLRIIKYIIENAKKAGIEAGMCGEAAGNPCMIPLLLSFGLDEFSVSPSNVLETRKNIASWSIREADEVTTSVMAMCTEKEVANYLSDYIAAKEQRSGFAPQNKEDKSSAPARAVAFASQTRRI